MQETKATQVQTLGQECLLEEEMGSHSSILAWEIPWTEKPGILWSLESEAPEHTYMHVCVCVCVFVCVCVYIYINILD